MTARHNFPTRLAIARELIARGAPSAPVAVADQLSAAGAEVRQHHDHIAAVMPILEPGRNWRQRIDARPSETVRAYLLAAVLDCANVCSHIRKGGPQPTFIQLPLRRIDCGRCVQTLRRPPADEGDRCDTCGTRGEVTFHPFALRMGPALIIGDACPACAGVLGIVQEVSA
jgi:hypothetical protein